MPLQFRNDLEEASWTDSWKEDRSPIHKFVTAADGTVMVFTVKRFGKQ